MFARSDIYSRTEKCDISNNKNPSKPISKRCSFYGPFYTQLYCRMQHHSGYKKVLTTIKFYSAHTKQDQENHQICFFLAKAREWVDNAKINWINLDFHRKKKKKKEENLIFFTFSLLSCDYLFWEKKTIYCKKLIWPTLGKVIKRKGNHALPFF